MRKFVKSAVQKLKNRVRLENFMPDFCPQKSIFCTWLSALYLSAWVMLLGIPFIILFIFVLDKIWVLFKFFFHS